MKFDKLLLSAAVTAALTAGPAFGQQNQEAPQDPRDQATAISQNQQNQQNQQDQAATSENAPNQGADAVAIPVPVPAPVFVPVPVEEGARGDTDTAQAGQGLDASTDDLGGESVYSSQDQWLGVGEIQEVVRSKQDGRLYAIVSSEEPLQVDEMAAVPLSEFNMQEDQILFSGNEQEFNQLFEDQPYEEDMYESLDEARNEQAGID